MNTEIHLSTAYFPPIQYFCKLLQCKTVQLEAHENFAKQSYRNRCNILSGNGKIALTAPVQKANSSLPIQSIQIDYSEDWQKQHARALRAAYGSSPFYEYYIDDFAFVFEEQHSHLWTLNERILKTCCKLLEINPKIYYTEDYIHTVPNDFRNSIHPKKSQQKPDKTVQFLPYTQVFSEKFAFTPNLCILDLLFNCGTESEIYLLKCIGKR